VEVSLDTLFSALVLIVVISSLFAFIYPAAYGPLTVTSEHELETVAKAVLDKILLTPGYPGGWGADILLNLSTMTSFGLAKEGAHSPFELDLDKVMRLANSSEFPFPATLSLSPTTVARLLGLESEERYGFMITITPALNITASLLSTFTLAPGYSVGSIFDIQVLNYARRPAANAEVTVLSILTVVTSGQDADISMINSSSSSAIADWSGRCTIDITNWLTVIKDELTGKELKKSTISIVVFAENAGIRAARVFDFDLGSRLSGSCLGNYIFICLEEDQPPYGAAHVINATEALVLPHYVLTGYLINETNGQSGLVVNAGAKKYRVYRTSMTLTDEVSVAFIVAKSLGKYFSIPSPRPPDRIQFGTGQPSAMKTSVQTRIVKIGALHYLFELAVWREGES